MKGITMGTASFKQHLSYLAAGALLLGSAAAHSTMSKNTSELGAIQSHSQSSMENTAPSTNSEIITVTGERPLSFFRDQYVKAQDEFFESLNNYTENDSFKIDCEMDKRAFTNIYERECQPRYVDEIIYTMNQKSLDFGSDRRGLLDKIQNLPSNNSIYLEIQDTRKKHLAHVKNIVKSTPEVQQKLLQFNQARYSLEQKRIETFGEKLASDKSVAVVEQTKEFIND
ncbi:hypothetical protein PN836_001490 [Ningiella sp. W23]|uniref:hypothetical protein n=1 Tax=Ningiella sp. W23 TaxID=3023715 RepID=UPI003756EF26